MSSTIPPFLCSTPPPIDFDETNDNDEDFSAYETNLDTEFGSFNDVTVDADSPKKIQKINETSAELPLPQDTNFSFYSNQQNSISSNDFKENCGNNKVNNDNANNITKVQNVNNFIKIITDDNTLDKSKQNNIVNNDDDIIIHKTLHSEETENNLKNDFETEDGIDQITDNIENYLNIDSTLQKNREDSPQSLEFGISHLSEDDSSIGEFQNVKINYDDNTSLPSLKFDPVGNVKSDTPIESVEENSKCKIDELNDKSELLDDTLIMSSAFQQQQTEIDENDKKSSKNNDDDDDNLRTKELNYEKFNNQNENISSDMNVKKVFDESVIKKSFEFDDGDNDSDEFDAFESFTCDRTTIQSNVNIVTQTQEVSDQQKDVFNSSTDVNNTFEADFSQFEAFSNNNECDNLSTEQNETIKIEDNENLTNESIDATSQITNKIEESIETDTKNEENKNDDEEYDDDFGEFNEFSEFNKDDKPPAAVAAANEISDVTTSLINIHDKINSIIKMMFPNDNDDDKNSELSIKTEIDDNKIYQRNDFNKLETNLNDIDSAKSLDYQWINSNVKHSLIKSLGIDSRNILYGEKWNSNVPRFAANLAFSPLEPLKPVKINENQSISMLTSKNSDTKMKIINKTDVPAVDFDWNSSGLVNPLDGSKKSYTKEKWTKFTRRSLTAIINPSKIMTNKKMKYQQKLSSKNHTPIPPHLYQTSTMI